MRLAILVGRDKPAVRSARDRALELMKTNPKLRLEQPADETIVIGGTRPLPVTE